jgi:hypothetical protein
MFVADVLQLFELHESVMPQSFVQRSVAVLVGGVHIALALQHEDASHCKVLLVDRKVQCGLQRLGSPNVWVALPFCQKTFDDSGMVLECCHVEGRESILFSLCRCEPREVGVNAKKQKMDSATVTLKLNTINDMD